MRCTSYVCFYIIGSSYIYPPHQLSPFYSTLYCTCIVLVSILYCTCIVSLVLFTCSLSLWLVPFLHSLFLFCPIIHPKGTTFTSSLVLSCSLLVPFMYPNTNDQLSPFYFFFWRILHILYPYPLTGHLPAVLTRERI